jgi:hypothetical protein
MMMPTVDSPPRQDAVFAMRHALSAQRSLLGWIFSFSFRLSQGVLNIFSLQGCLQAIRFFSSLHKYLHNYGMVEFWNNGMMGNLYCKEHILLISQYLTHYSNIPMSQSPIIFLFDQPDS